ncbi:MAG: hypothetical protein LBU65_10435 [Planctomycetaceae bacterium]|nr:hypothetical protein [Planctomycetaceae bacterium]
MSNRPLFYSLIRHSSAAQGFCADHFVVGAVITDDKMLSTRNFLQALTL